ncbi:MAG: histidine ammonia-lyase [Clostridia bacterium]|nr:histidine ammonia-lyase [Clostridiales bacterium]MDD7308004.1 histidine ammonia-lyase [Eubacteriales bacterium]MDO4351617.1 histidine ammonia-lyase [Clostridia bacterium]MDY2933127.1 histidine ammonia-lyase [Anaerovoracaceae bacterium]MEE0182221.1 histidine ammonia-lyase [Anaerovoracaceae bacterium]
MAVIINGRDLTVEEVIRVCRGYEKVEIAPEAKEAVIKARNYIEKKLEEGAVIYGLTTGFGKFANVVISREEAEQLQKNLIISHTCAMGEPYETKYVRAAMLLRCNALSRGNSGIRLETIQTMIDMLNAGIHPVIPEKGSLGASGDLAPLSHIALALIGLGEVEYKGQIVPAAEAMAKEGIIPVVLAAKEGLALNNGTQMMTAVGVNVLWDAMHLMKTADIATAMTAEALHGITKAYDHKVHDLRGHQGQKDAAENLRTLLAGSKNAFEVQPSKVQDPYSLRCIPQIHGASRDAIQYVYEAVSRELNAVTDNPIVFPDEDEVISGGNFHGQPMALAFDFLKMAISEFADVSERRAERLINPQLSEGLPAFLTKYGGVCSGFMIAQYAAASMVSENKIYAHPACVDSIPSSGNQEDHVSMGTTSARTAAMVLDNAQKVIGIELAAAAQGIWLRQEIGESDISNLAPATKAAYDYIRTVSEPVDDDILMHDELKKFDEMVKDFSILEAVEKVVTLK